jgi:hypothetical protein
VIPERQGYFIAQLRKPPKEVCGYNLYVITAMDNVKERRACRALLFFIQYIIIE